MDNAFDIPSVSQGSPGPSLSSAVLAALSVLFICCCAWLAGASPAQAGVGYPCDDGRHKFWSCVPADKPPPDPCHPTAGDPVDVLTGRLSEVVVDWSSGGTFPLELRRSYTSTSLTLDASPYSSLARGWRTNFDARVRMDGATAAQSAWASFILPDSFEYTFVKQSGVWRQMGIEWSGPWWAVSLKTTPRSDLDVSLTLEGQQFVLRTPNGVKYVFDTASHAPDAQWRMDGYRTQVLSEIRFPGGYTQSIAYKGDYPTRISDNLGRWIQTEFTAVSSRSTNLTQIVTSDGTRIRYSYQNRFPGLWSGSPVDYWSLRTVTYPDQTPSTDSDNPKITYDYKDETDKPGLLMTGMTDERGVRFASWSYDAKDRVLSSEHAGGMERTTFAYDDANSVVTVTSPLGRATKYSFRMLPGYVRQLVAVDGIASSNCAASNTRYEYDASGFRVKATDAEGRVTTWTRNSRGLPLTETQAAGTALARTRTMTWDATRPLMLSLAVPGLTTSYTYDAQGRVLSVTETDTTLQNIPYVTRGQKRTTSYTYAPPSVTSPPTPVALGPLTMDGPMPGPVDMVFYGYDSNGNVATVTNALGQVTRITRRDGGSRPLSLTDANGTVTNMTYDLRGRLSSVTVNPGTGQSRTAFSYDAAGQLTRVTAPDNTSLSYVWDAARRLASVTNAAGERIEYGYNANGDVTSRSVKSSSGAIIRQQSAVFDELGRLLRSIGAGGQETAYAYDRLDNLLQFKDPRGGVFAYGYDALQRVIRTTDQAGAAVSLARDGQDNLTAYRDPRGVTTAYVRNGFGEVIQESGPDVGTTVITRDARGLATSVTDPRGVVTNLSYDSLGRLTAESYPSDIGQRVSYGYDGTQNGNEGIGRLTAITDGSGSMSRVYDVLGRVTSETRTIAGRSYVTGYAYNAAGRLTAITYPSGRVVSFLRNNVGQVSSVLMKPPGSAAGQYLATSLRWSPLSGKLAGLTFGNGLTASMSYDGDGRLTAQQVLDGTRKLIDLSYGYGDGINLTAVNDNAAPASSLSLAYDPVQRLSQAKGPWGLLAYSYTPTGDRLREVATPPTSPAVTTTLAYPANSNRLRSLTPSNSVPPRSYSYDAAGNLITQRSGSFSLDFTYNVRNRPVTATSTGSGSVIQTSRYAYNALEQLVSRATTAAGGPKGTVHYIYALDGSLLAEADGTTGQIQREYVWLPAEETSVPLPLALITGVSTATPSLLMVHADHLGRPIRLTDASRTTVWQASYRPFGEVESILGKLEQNLRFPGQYFLMETGFAYNWHRFYDPATGRYTQPDPLRFVDGPSVYRYVAASPMMRVDREGLSSTPFPAGLCFTNPAACATICMMVPSICSPEPHAPPPPLYCTLGGDAPPPSSDGGGGDEDRCRVVKESCIEHCTMAMDNAALPDLQSTNFRRCINQCMYDNGCGGNNYSDGWDNGKLGTPKPWPH